MAQQTAVEWFADHLKLVDKNTYNDLVEILEQAKQMDKERIIETYNDGYRDGMTDHNNDDKDISEFDNARLYYNEKYEK